MSPQTKERLKYWGRKLECPVDDNANYENNYVYNDPDYGAHRDTNYKKWCNRDLIPIPDDRRTWTYQGYAGYWIITGEPLLSIPFHRINN